MSDMVRLPLPTGRAVVIDLDSGTVIGTNVVVAYVTPEQEEEITSSDSAAVYHGSTYGYSLFADLTDE